MRVRAAGFFEVRGTCRDMCFWFSDRVLRVSLPCVLEFLHGTRCKNNGEEAVDASFGDEGAAGQFAPTRAPFCLRCLAGFTSGASLCGRPLVPAAKLTRKWMGEVEIEKSLIEKVNEKRLSAQDKYKGSARKTVSVKVGDYVKIKTARIIQKGESKFSVPKIVVKICKNAVMLEDGNWWNKEKLSLAREVKLNNRTLVESTKMEQDKKDIRSRNSLCGEKVLDKDSMHSSKQVCEKNDGRRTVSTRNRMLPRRFRDFML
ncbi:hypothetical protein NDU88_011130 [Pleurodeles waltl]|uniref:Uncharacterized protein n=1 Tax=Pleurodeles waltl TaxID=8319 RepID=A0AAV7Q0W4_PLEWA|nr:hypothetical protein NDU88_011130 [Pleurodeles waltl]